MANYEQALAHPNVQAFLALIRYTEGATYNTLYGGETFDSFSDHPRRVITCELGGRKIPSSAAGAYQFLAKTWDGAAKALGLPDFSPHSQDIAAVYLIDGRRALVDVMAARWEDAIAKCNREWASLPGSPYGQPTKTMARCLAYLNSQSIPAVSDSQSAPAEPVTDHQETPMLPFVAAAIPALIQAAPALIRVLGEGEQAEKNAKTAEIVASIAKTVTAESTIEGAVTKIQGDAVLAQAFREQVEAKWYTIVGESGGGGIDGARRADQAAIASRSSLNSPALWISAALLPLVYIVVGAVVFMSGWPQDVRTMVVSSVLSLVLGAVTGYYLGTSYSSARKTELTAAPGDVGGHSIAARRSI